MPNASINLHEITGGPAASGRPSGSEALEDFPEFEARGQRHVFPDSTSGTRTTAHPEIARRSSESLEHRMVLQSPGNDRLMNARQVADKLGVSERWVRDHTTRRSPKIRAVKLGTLIRYRWVDVEVFMESLDTFRTSRHPRFGV
jgi:hypothetical protein